VHAAVAGPRVPGGGVTRQGVALADRKSLLHCRMISLSRFLFLFPSLSLSLAHSLERKCALFR
jgi:hypothetical protein